jgi:hypothetical protein
LISNRKKIGVETRFSSGTTLRLAPPPDQVAEALKRTLEGIKEGPATLDVPGAETADAEAVKGGYKVCTDGPTTWPRMRLLILGR